jgi:hypothetical protein
MMYSHGDRVRWEATAEDGFPLVRYGFVRSMTDDSGPVVVMFDGDLGGEVIDADQLALVSITSVELRLEGDDLLDDPDLRRGLTSLWQAEAESAGLDVDSIKPHGYGDHDGNGGWCLASLTSGDRRYAVKAFHHNNHIVVHAERSFE